MVRWLEERTEMPQEVADLFREREVSGVGLLQLTREALREMGLKKLVLLKKLGELIAELRKKDEEAAAAAAEEEEEDVLFVSAP